MKIYRKFTQEWEDRFSEFNRLREGNVLYDFFEYASNMYDDLKTIKKYYCKKFNENFKKPIDSYIDDLLKLCNAFNKICIKSGTPIYGLNSYYLYENLNKDILEIDGAKQKLKDQYYEKLEPLANQVFKIEASIADFVEDIWLNTLTNSKTHDNDKYSYLAHLCIDRWRKQNPSEEYLNYCNNLAFFSTSYVTDQKTKFFLENEYANAGMVGYIVKIEKGAFIAGGNNDIFSTELIDGKCEYREKYIHSPVRILHIKGNNVVLGAGTRICTPEAAINAPVGTPSEILLDKEFIHIERAFYTMPTIDNYKEDVLKKVNEMAQKAIIHEPLRLVRFNKLKQFDYEVLCSM